MFVIETAEWHAEITVAYGANLCRLQHKPTKMEILHAPESLDALKANPTYYGIPVLFPPNRIDGGRFIWQGKEYQLPVNEPERNNHLHGFVMREPWRINRIADGFVEMRYRFVATAGFPHDFELIMSYEFSPGQVRQHFSVHNRSAAKMPFALGFHTAFNLPEDGWVTVTAPQERWEITQPRFLPSGRKLPWHHSRLDNKEAISIHCPVEIEIVDGKPFRGARIFRPSDQCVIAYEISNEFNHWCLWNNKGSGGLFCPEPMTSMVNAPNMSFPNCESIVKGIPPYDSITTSQSVAIKPFFVRRP